MPQMRIIPNDKLFIDPDVQLQYAIREKQWRAYGADWHPERVGFLIVVPTNGNVPEEFTDKLAIVEGRHRYLGGQVAGVREWRCDVHDEIDFHDKAAKANLKLGFDYHRRNVSALEHFEVRVMADDLIANEIYEIVLSAGFDIGKTKPRADDSRVLGCVRALERFYDSLGRDAFRRMIQLNTKWLDTPGATNADWIGGLAVLARDGYDDKLTSRGHERLKEVDPAKVLRTAKGTLLRQGILSSQGGTSGFSNLMYEIASILRRKAGLRQLPRRVDNGKDVRSRPVD